MATEKEEEDFFLNQLDTVQDKFIKNIQECRESLDTREGEVLNELEQIKISYKCQESVDKLYRLRKKGAGGDDQNMRELKAEIDKTRSRFKDVMLEWDKNLKGTLLKTGFIRVVAVPEFKNKEKPVIIACKHSYETSAATEVFKYPRSIAIDSFTNNIFICDYGNDRVQVFDESLKYLFKISDKLKQPFGICININNLYVTQSVANTLSVYYTDGSYINSVGAKGNGKLQFDNPRGVDALKEKDTICVCDWNNNRVQCLDLNLGFRFFISDISHPLDIKLTQQELVVLVEDNPCLRFYDYSRNLIRMIITRGDEGQVISSFQFCLDIDSNVLMTDKFGEFGVMIFSKTGDLLCKFGERGEEEGEFIQPIGIAIDYKGRIIVGSSNSKRCIQMF